MVRGVSISWVATLFLVSTAFGQGLFQRGANVGPLGHEAVDGTPPPGPVEVVPGWAECSQVIFGIPRPVLRIFTCEFVDGVASGEDLTDGQKFAVEFIRTVSRVAREADVLVLLPRDLSSGGASDEPQRALERAVSVVGELPDLGRLRIRYLVADTSSTWIRDYGPVLVRNISGELSFVDFVYGARGLRKLDDRVAIALASSSRQRRADGLGGLPLGLYRSKLNFDLGDFAFDGAGTAFVSSATLRKNSLSAQQVKAELGAYLGVEDLVVLHPLPGDTVKHLDMFMQVAGPNLILLGHYPDSCPTDESVSRLVAEARLVMKSNLDLILDHYTRKGLAPKAVHDARSLGRGGMNVVLVPMPTPIRERQRRLNEATARQRAAIAAIRDLRREMSACLPWEQLLQAAQDWVVDLEHYCVSSLGRLVETVAFNGRVDFPCSESVWNCSLVATVALGGSHVMVRAMRVAGSSLGIQAELASELVETTGKRIESEEEELEEATESYDDALRKREFDVYRTYLNHLFVRKSTEAILFIPSYEGLDVTEVKGTLKASYERTHNVPVRVVLIPSDRLIRGLGSIHCLARRVFEGVEVFSHDLVLSGRPSISKVDRSQQEELVSK